MKKQAFTILLTIAILGLLQIAAIAQQNPTVIQGKITDANTNEPVPFANVFFKGTTIGTTTDFDGRYKLTTRTPGDSLTVMVVNYKKRSKAIRKGATQTVDYQLVPTTFELGEVLIEAGENPAWAIVR